MQMSLWGDEFIVTPSSKEIKNIKAKIEAPISTDDIKKSINSSKVSIEQKIQNITDEVNRILGRYKNDTICITDKYQLESYIDSAVRNGEISIDTETNNSLDPLTCKLMGGCFYVEGEKNAYIPVNHINRYTGELLHNQLTEKDIKKQLERLKDTHIIMHNAPFDYRVIKNTCDIKLNVYWDTMIGARMLNENEKAGLKIQYIEHIDPTIEKYSIEHLFKSLPYEIFPPELFALYAATDAFMTMKLQKYQFKEFSKKENSKIFKVFMNVEMPIVEVAAEMEETGICIDDEVLDYLDVKLQQELSEVKTKIQQEISSNYSDAISKWRLTEDANRHSERVSKAGKITMTKSKSEQLKEPVEFGSSAQLSILLYDVIKVPVIDKKKPRGTEEEILEQINLPICKQILEYRGLAKLKSTFIDSIREKISTKDCRLHSHFNQLGTATGRFSSTSPNLQQIPSHNKIIRTMFKAADGYALVGSDFSQQEPRTLCHFSGDESMSNAYREKRDLYATVAAKVHHLDYWDCMENTQDGKTNPQGEKRRSDIKSVVLGLLYGRQAASIAEQIGSTPEEAQKLIDDFFDGFPKVKDWVNKTKSDAHKTGYVEDIMGRRRRLPELLLPEYNISTKVVDFNPLIGDIKHVDTIKESCIKEKWTKKLEKARGAKQYKELIDKAALEGIKITSNTAKIAQAERQSVNARVQGSAATITKLAMIRIYHDQKMRDLGFRLMICVHDELIGECPKENREEVSQRLSQLMIDAAAEVCSIPMKCDAVATGRWYEDKFSAELAKKYAEELSKGKDEEEALYGVHQLYPIVNSSLLPKIIQKNYNFDEYENFINKNWRQELNADLC